MNWDYFAFLVWFSVPVFTQAGGLVETVADGSMETWRLAAKHQAEWTGGGALTIEASERQARWWLDAIASEMDGLKGDDAADLYDAYEVDDIPKWLRAQASTGESDD